MRLRPIPIVLLLTALAAGGMTVNTDHGQALLGYVLTKVRGGYTLEERVAEFSPKVDARLHPMFTAAGLPYPPGEVAYVAIKDAKRLEVYARMNSATPWVHIRDYPILGLSGRIGPKLTEGDNQVPEGVYRAEFLNPNSRFHLSIRLNFPNAFDQRKAQADGRSKLGGDIMIHGTSSSVGCLAVGNQASEDLFVLAALVSKERVRIVVSPTDFRIQAAVSNAGQPPWINELYGDIWKELTGYRRD